MGKVNGDEKQQLLDFDAPVPEWTAPSPKDAAPVNTTDLSDSEPEPKAAEEPPFIFEPKIDGDVMDYSDYPADKMYISSKRNILTSDRPQYVPPYDLKYMARNYYIPPVCKVGGKYILQSGGTNPKYFKLSLDGLAATIDYYTKLQKAVNAKEIEDEKERLKEAARLYFSDPANSANKECHAYRTHKAALDGEIKFKVRPIRTLSKNRMTYDQIYFFRENNYDKKTQWGAWREIRNELSQKMDDMSCQIDELESVYTKGAETSYGDKNTNRSLYEDYGILVKRQNGDAISPEEIDDIKTAFNKITPVFGSLKQICHDYGLKVSHSGIKNMHARKAIGIFYDFYKAIGVKFGDKTMNHLVLAHELTHFLDSRAGKESSHFFASDLPGSTENKIAAEFRSNMNKRNKNVADSKYLNRTCECLARAMEQYAAFAVSPMQYLYYTNTDSYVSDEKFKEKILPLVETLIKERQELWNGKDGVMENNAILVEAAIINAGKETENMTPHVDLPEMKDGILESLALHCAYQKEWYEERLKALKNEQFVPAHISGIALEYKKAEKLNSLVQKEYGRRLKEEDTSIFPVLPDDNTSANFKTNFQKLLQYPRYKTYPIYAARELVENATPKNRNSINAFLKSLGCTDEPHLEKLLGKWKTEMFKPPAKKEPDAGISMAS